MLDIIEKVLLTGFVGSAVIWCLIWLSDKYANEKVHNTIGIFSIILFVSAIVYVSIWK